MAIEIAELVKLRLFSRNRRGSANKISRIFMVIVDRIRASATGAEIRSCLSRNNTEALFAHVYAVEQVIVNATRGSVWRIPYLRCNFELGFRVLPRCGRPTFSSHPYLLDWL